MCGIAGLIAKHPITERRWQSFISASNLMNHRGPDYTGIYSGNNFLLIHHRLSILDLDPRSNQPLCSSCNRFLTIFNGEIYNFQELQQLYKIQPKTTSDTEILLESFALLGKKAIPNWNGIFACAIYDRSKQQITFARDRFGVKPLYIYEDEEVVAFSSEAKVIMNWLPSFKLNNQVLSQFLWYGNTTGAQTIVEKLDKLMPGEFWTFSLSTNTWIEKKAFWSLSDITENNLTEDEAINQTRNLLEAAVKRQLVADVPVGVLLSGGIDSSSIVAFASRHYSGKLDTYSVEYDYNIGGESELTRAALIAKKYGTNHHELKVETKDVVTIFRDLVFQYDEPFADPASIPLYQLAKVCSFDKRVILQGDGGDELFAGYRRYNVMKNYWFWRMASQLYPLIPNTRWRERMKRIQFVLSRKHRGELLSYYLTEEVPYKNPYQVLNSKKRKEVELQPWFSDYFESAQRFRQLDRVQQLLYVDTDILLPNRYLEKVDKATMLNSIEARVPFLDNNLANFALSLSANHKVKKGKKKYILKRAMEGLVPDEILYGPKRGFSVPFREWLRKDLFNFAFDTFKSHKMGILDEENLIKILNTHKTRKADFANLLWKSLVLCHWLNIYKHKIEH